MDDSGRVVLNTQTRVRDVKKVHDTTKQHKKEKRTPEEDREFKEFLEESEKAVDDTVMFMPDEPLPEPPPQQMLNMLGAFGPPINIEPIEETPAAPEKEETQEPRETREDQNDSQPEEK
jgi:hypothetical protein